MKSILKREQRIGGITFQNNTPWGSHQTPAKKLLRQESRTKLLIILTDGRLRHDYGDARYAAKTYAKP